MHYIPAERQLRATHFHSWGVILEQDEPAPWAGQRVWKKNGLKQDVDIGVWEKKNNKEIHFGSTNLYS